MARIPLGKENMAELRITLLGEDASLGSIPVADVVSLLTGIEKAIVRAAEVRQGRTGGLAGRRNAEREAATRLTLRALEPGSLTAVLDIPGQDTVQDPLFASSSLGELAAEDVMQAVNGGEAHPRVAEALAGMATSLGIGGRHQKLEIEFSDGKRRTRSHIDATIIEQLRQKAEQPTVEGETTITGTLFAVNFESGTAQIRINPINAIRRVRFQNHLQEQVKEALLSQTQFTGKVIRDTEDDIIISLDLQNITPPEQPSLENSDFWSSPTIEELAKSQGIDLTHVNHVSTEVEEDDPEIDAFFEALGLNQ